MGGVAGPALRFSEGDQQLDVRRVVDRRFGEPAEIERLAVVADGVVVGELRQRRISRPTGVVHGLGRVGRRHGRLGVVVGQRRETVLQPGGVDRLDRLRRLAVQRHPASGGKLVVERCPDQGVRESILAGRPGRLAHQTGGHGLVEKATARRSETPAA